MSRFERDDDHVPARWRIELLISQLGGPAFPVSATVPIPEVDGATPRQVVAYVWPRMREYVMSTIADLSTPTSPHTTPAIVGQTVVLP